ncbi:MAG: hypothetical protein GX234_08180 [Clostridiales bacterium]|nr:hypothetical protein [Clostridiales bacterium]
MSKKIMAVCDLEHEYADKLAQYLEQKQGFPFEIRTFLDVDRLLEFCREKEEPIELLLISESAYCKELQDIADMHIMILNESGKVTYPEYRNVDKYQTAENIVREVMCYCAEQLSENMTQPLLKTGTGILGFYSPVRRCMQTSLALTLGQLLAENYRVLYLNMEGYSGFSQRFYTENAAELTELIYYAHNMTGKLIYRVESMVQRLGKLEYVPPVLSASDLNLISGEEWKELLRQLVDRCQYDYILLDLSDRVRGLFELLRMCTTVYTIKEDDFSAEAKLCEYKEDLKRCGYEDIAEKTRECHLPWIEKLPKEAGMLPYTKLGKYVQSQLMGGMYDRV